MRGIRKYQYLLCCAGIVNRKDIVKLRFHGTLDFCPLGCPVVSNRVLNASLHLAIQVGTGNFLVDVAEVEGDGVTHQVVHFCQLLVGSVTDLEVGFKEHIVNLTVGLGCHALDPCGRTLLILNAVGVEPSIVAVGNVGVIALLCGVKLGVGNYTVVDLNIVVYHVGTQRKNAEVEVCALFLECQVLRPDGAEDQ